MIRLGELARSGAGRRPVPCFLVAALIYAALALLMVSPALVPGRTLSASDGLWVRAPWNTAIPPGIDGAGSNVEIGDQYHVFQPFLEHTRERLPHIPLWNPFLMAGRPFLANGQSAIFSPFSAPAYVLPFWRSLAVMAALKLFVAALGTYLLGRALGMRFGAALLSGLVFAFSLWFVVWLSWPTTSSWALLPWLWLCAERILRAPGLLSTCGLGVVVAAQFFGGHPESSFHVLVFTGVFFVVRLVHHRRAGRASPAVGRAAAALAGGVALGSALAALTLIPLAELLSHSVDQEQRAEFAGVHVRPRYLLGLFSHDHWGRPTRVTIDGLVAPFLHTHAFYVGALPLMLAGAALLLRRTFERVAIAAVGALALAIVVGTPPFPAVLGELPGFRVTDNSRLVVVFVLCVALLAGWGLDELTSLQRTRRRRAVAALAAIIFVTPIVWVTIAGNPPWASLLWDSLRVAWGFAASPERHAGQTVSEVERMVAQIRLVSLLEWLLPAAAALLLLALRLSGRLRPLPFAALAVLIVAVDLFKAGVGINPAIPLEHAEQPVTPALRYLQRQVPNRFVGTASTVPLGPGNPLPADVAMRYGLLDARGYDFPIEERYMRFWRRGVAGESCPYHFCTTGAMASPETLRALSLLGVSDVLASAADPPLRVPGLRVAYSGRDARVYSNAFALPRAFVVDRQVVTADADQALAALMSPRFDPRAAAITEEQLPDVRASAEPAGNPAGSARFVSYENERVRLTVAARRPGILVLTDTHYPGWTATVDEHPVPVHRVDYLFRGVRLAAGQHRVEFRYEPASWRTGKIVSGVALVGMAGLLGLGLRRRSRGGRAT